MAARPQHRRDAIKTVACGLFRAHGFDRVGLSQIAAEVGISAPALYRHFRGKQDLLRAILDDQLSALNEAVTAGGSDLYRALAGFAVEHTAFGVLWQRERPKLEDIARQPLNDRMTGLIGRIALGTDRDPVLVRAMLAVVESTTYYLQRPGRHNQHGMLRAVLAAIGGTTGLTLTTPARPPAAEPLLSARPWLSRRQAILILAPQLTLAQGGYDAVTMEDLGIAAGMSGAAAYHYFASKAEVFEAAFAQAVNWGQVMLEQAWAAATSPDELLARVLTRSVRLAEDFPAIIRTGLNNTVELPEPQRTAALAGGAQYTAEWQRCLAVVRPDLTKDDLEVLTHAVLTTIGDLTQPGETDGLVLAASDLVALTTRMVQASHP